MDVTCRYCDTKMDIATDGHIMSPALGKCTANWSSGDHQVHPGDKPVRPTTLSALLANANLYEDNGQVLPARLDIGHFDVRPPVLHGVVLHYYDPNRKPRIMYTYTRAYRNNTLVPFHTYYHGVRMVETF